MRLNLFSLIIICSLLFACSSQKKAVNPVSSSETAAIQETSPAPRDGSSFDNAIIITEKTSATGIRAEYVWVREHYPNSKVISQSLQHNKKKSYDVLTIQASNGDQKDIYFDITNFYGKW